MHETRLLVDWDNCPNIAEDNAGQVKAHIERMVMHMMDSSLGAFSANNRHRIYVRLYGGWREHKKPTRRAERLNSTLGLLNNSINVVHNHQEARVQVALALATSAFEKAFPAVPLAHTFRSRRGTDARLQCDDCPPECQLRRVFTGGSCGLKGCGRSQDDLFRNDTQKLVDTMLAVDLSAFALRDRRVAYCSDDDDILSAAFNALALGLTVIHLSPRGATGHLTTYDEAFKHLASGQSKYKCIPLVTGGVPHGRNQV